MLTSKKSARLRLPWLSMQPVPMRQTSSKCIGCGVTFTSCLLGAAPVTAPLAVVGKTTWDMKTFQAWLLWLLGSTWRLEPYQTASARPGPPALTQGKTLVASPVAVEPSLTWTGAVQVVQPLAALDALTKIWRWPGSVLLTAQTANRLRAVSMERTEKSTSGDPLVAATGISCVRSWPPFPLSSRKCSEPLASGVPMFIHSPLDLHPLLVVQPAA